MPTIAEVWIAMQDVQVALGYSGPPARSMRVKSPSTKVEVELALENERVGGSFKFRAAAAVLSDARRSGDRQLVTPSSGNFGLALATLAQGTGIEVLVVLPRSCPIDKGNAISATGATVVQSDGEFDACVRDAEREAQKQQSRLVSPDNDPFVIAGSAGITYALATRNDPRAIRVFSPLVGAGSLAGMVVGYQALLDQKDRLEAEGFVLPGMTFSAVHIGRNKSIEPVPLPERTIFKVGKASIFDVMAGDVEKSSPAFAYLVKQGIRSVPVRKAEIEDATFDLSLLDVKAEAGAAAAYASAMRADAPNGTRHVAVMTGGNVPELLYGEVLKKVDVRWWDQGVPDWANAPFPKVAKSPGFER